MWCFGGPQSRCQEMVLAVQWVVAVPNPSITMKTDLSAFEVGGQQVVACPLQEVVGEVVPMVLMVANLGGRSGYPLRRIVPVIRAL